MSDVTEILSKIEAGDEFAADELLPLVYDELRQLAAARMVGERPDHTLQGTALVHEAYLRLVGSPNGQSWENRGHFFAAASEAMRRILVEAARRKNSTKRGSDFDRVEFPQLASTAIVDPLDFLALDEALGRLEQQHPQKAQLVKLRYFGGCSLEETAEFLGVSRATAQRQWAYARAWLFGQLNPE